MTTIYFIRHSVRFKTKDIESYNTPYDKFIKDDKIILDVEGENRAKILSEEEEFKHIDKIYASDMVRSQSTAKYFCDKFNLGLNIDYRLNERKSGIPNDEEYPDWFQRQYYDESFKTVGGESQAEVRKRVLECLNDILDSNKDKIVAIFSHGYAITFSILKWCKLISVGEDKKLTIKYNDKILMDKIINAPEVFKMTFDNKELINIELIEFDDLPFNNGI